ncbi:hypothetical protein NA57DRAFT_77742 [Rhizodiscina lignyota]|uniref:RING-type domain-containing protein n=1 Tax=Rhizodiscina lignyota TaxID=1504668 RepID=A0A9P4IDX5_9PEZI|nr:hypothetical protein NA57DRAFT_77742 [Rhizodiscina lignyota]
MPDQYASSSPEDSAGMETRVGSSMFHAKNVVQIREISDRANSSGGDSAEMETIVPTSMFHMKSLPQTLRTRALSPHSLQAVKHEAPKSRRLSGRADTSPEESAGGETRVAGATRHKRSTLQTNQSSERQTVRDMNGAVVCFDIHAQANRIYFPEEVTVFELHGDWYCGHDKIPNLWVYYSHWKGRMLLKFFRSSNAREPLRILTNHPMEVENAFLQILDYLQERYPDEGRSFRRALPERATFPEPLTLSTSKKKEGHQIILFGFKLPAGPVGGLLEMLGVLWGRLRRELQLGEKDHRCHLVNMSPSDMKNRGILIEGADMAALIKARAAIENLLAGVILKDGKAPLWHDHFETKEGIRELHRLSKQNDVIIISDFKKTIPEQKVIRLLGIPSRVASASAVLVDWIKKYHHGKVYRIKLTEDMVEIGYARGFQRITQSFGRGRATFALTGDEKYVHIKGTREDVEKAREFLAAPTAVDASSSDPQSEQPCVICLCDADDPIRSKCGHFWCRACFVKLCTLPEALRPIKCYGRDGEGQCTHLFNFDELFQLLSKPDFDTLVRRSMEAYVSKYCSHYMFCPTPGCEQLHKVNSGSNFKCSGCLVSICTMCKGSGHPHISCDEYETLTNEGKRLFVDWMGEHNAKRCPMKGCGVVVEKEEGTCNHVQCSKCKTHFCFLCLAMFVDGGSVYDHMWKVHDSIGIGE